MLWTISRAKNSTYAGQEELVGVPEKLKTTMEQAQGQKGSRGLDPAGKATSAALLNTTDPEAHCMVLAAFLVNLEKSKRYQYESHLPS